MSIYLIFSFNSWYTLHFFRWDRRDSNPHASEPHCYYPELNNFSFELMSFHNMNRFPICILSHMVFYVLSLHNVFCSLFYYVYIVTHKKIFVKWFLKIFQKIILQLKNSSCRSFISRLSVYTSSFIIFPCTFFLNLSVAFLPASSGSNASI